MTATLPALTRPRRIVTLAASVIALALLLLTPSARAANVSGGTTTIALDPTVTPLFYSAPFSFSIHPIAPGSVTLRAGNWRIALPISGGTYSRTSKTGTFRHRGGYFYVRWMGSSWSQHRLASPWLQVNGTPEVTAIANGGARASILDANLTLATYKYYRQAGRDWVKISNVVLLWSANGSALFNGVFGIPVGAGVTFGTATVRARL